MPPRKKRHNKGKRPKKPTHRRVGKGALLLENLLEGGTPSFPTWHIPEPKLIFAKRQLCEDPKTGITLFGPAALDHGARSSIRVGVVGTGQTTQLLLNWLERAKGRITAGLKPKGTPYDPVLSPDFPGFDSGSVFECGIDLDERFREMIPDKVVETAVMRERYPERVNAAVEHVLERLGVLADKEPGPDVVICAMPALIEERCGVAGRRGLVRKPRLTDAEKAQRRMERKAARVGQVLLKFPEPEGEEATPHRDHWDLHNALKARGMKFGIPTQLVWESTLRGTGCTQDPATVAWNFFTALYYKAGNVPWELDVPSRNTCFVGVTFYRESHEADAATRTSLAQIFSESGEGLILKGDRVEWDREADKKPHLGRDSSRRLLQQALDLYCQHFNGPPERVVVHKTSRYWPEELQGFREALNGIHSYDLLTLERRGIRFMRLGYHPPVRGTVVQLAPRDYVVFTRGYVPMLRCYPGQRIPNPLEVVEHHGDSTAVKVCSEILALTKLNWNTCAFAGGSPITIAFSKRVGEILRELPDDQAEGFQSKYRFYM